jgi:molecular chaperone HtpG
VKRVFITDECEGLVYPWLRFIRGVIDSSDLPLNISREMLQTNPVVSKIRQGITKRILSDLAKLADKEPETFNTAWQTFGAVIKEGLYDAPEHREAIFSLCRFTSTNDLDKTITLKEYKESMPKSQKDIYYISGDSLASVKNAPQLEGFKARGINVLFMTDTIDEFWLQHNFSYDGLNFKSVTRAGADLENIGKTDNEKTKDKQKDNKEFDILLAKLQQVLVNDVHNVTLSKRLQDSPVCFVTREGQADFQMEKVMKIQQKVDLHNNPILEINPNHPLIQSLAKQGDKIDEDSLWLLFDQARILQGQAPKDPTAFTKRLNKLMGN